MKNITNYNSKGEIHGYQELYNVYGVAYRGNWKHGELIGYLEYHQGKEIRFHIK